MPIVLRVDPAAPDPAVIAEAAGFIRDGLVVAYPTDTLYGLAVDPRKATAVSRLFALKGRPETSALTLIAADMAHVRAAGEMNATAERLAVQWWPGPLTLLISASGVLAPAVLAGGSTVGIRIPAQPAAIALARAAGFCITATSANRSGSPAASTAPDTAAALPEVDAILDGGPSPGGRPSTIVDVSRPEPALVRAGPIAFDHVLRSLK